MMTSDRVEEQNLSIILSTAIDEGQTHRARVPCSRGNSQLTRDIEMPTVPGHRDPLPAGTAVHFPPPTSPRRHAHHALAPIVTVSATTPIGNPVLSVHHRCSDMTEGTKPDRMATAVTRQARIPPSRRTNSGHRGDCFPMRERGAPQGQPPALHVDVDQPPFDIYTNALRYLDTDSAKWPMIHVLIFTSRNPTPNLGQTQRHQPRSRLGGCPIRIVEVGSFIFRANVARHDDIPDLIFALEQGAAGICRAVVVDLHRGLAHLLVGNRLLRALESWSASIHPPRPVTTRLLTSTVLSRTQAQMVPGAVSPRHASWWHLFSFPGEMP